MRKPLVLVLHSGYRPFREYLLRMVARHADVWLFQDAAPTWETPCLTGHTRVDLGDREAVLAAALELAGRRRVDGVLCWNELLVERAAEVQQLLGVPGAPPEAVTRCRDKLATRRALEAAGVPSARFAPVGSLAEARSAAGRLGYPVVVKPRGLGGSVGVKKAHDDAELEAAYAEAAGAVVDGAPDFGAEVLVEEYLTGEEISVDCAIRGGEPLPLFLARKVCGYPPYFEEVAHSVDAADPLLADPALLDLLRRAHQAVGYHTGITHTEVKLTPDGPRVVEINARLGGDLIPLVASVASGVDAGQAAVAVGCDRPLPEPPRPSRVAAVRFLYPEQDCVAAEVSVDRSALPDTVAGAESLVEPGHELRLPPAGHITGRYAYVIVSGPTAQACWHTAEAAAEAVHLRAA